MLPILGQKYSYESNEQHSNTLNGLASCLQQYQSNVKLAIRMDFGMVA